MKRRGKEFWNNLIIEYQTKECTREEFCSIHNIKEEALKYHLRKSSVASHQNNPFMPVSMQSITASQITLELPHGIKLRIEG